MPGMSRAQGQVFGGAQLSFQHCNAAKGGLKASEKQPLVVILDDFIQDATQSAEGCPWPLSSSGTGAPTASPR